MSTYPCPPNTRTHWGSPYVTKGPQTEHTLLCLLRWPANQAWPGSSSSSSCHSASCWLCRACLLCSWERQEAESDSLHGRALGHALSLNPCHWPLSVSPHWPRRAWRAWGSTGGDLWVLKIEWEYMGQIWGAGLLLGPPVGLIPRGRSSGPLGPAGL